MASATYGACYSINSNLSGEATSLLRSSLPGPDLGLTIVVNLDQVQYLQNRITKNAGARYRCITFCWMLIFSIFRVTFHNASVRPLVNEYGYDLQPQTSTNFALHTVREGFNYKCWLKARKKFLWAAYFPAIFLPTLCKLFIKIVYTRLEHPYTSECFPDWTHTNYSTNLTSSSTNWPYSFMVRRKWYTYSFWSDSQFVTPPLTK